ncbi:MAG TPA: CocE/NonD family hydrolase [Acidobacteriaceae bacterium]|nr:CocE/NonD family hydrolase [Acidobacteriaceae bacterium]
MARIDCGNGIVLERGVVCKLADGTRLLSDHYYPETGGPFPTLLMRQPYGRDIASTVVYAHPVWFARHGYYVVIQDVRGRGGSEGKFYPFRHERKDGAETIRWLLRHPQCNGRIGMYGFSYQGLTQLLAAAEKPEGLVCIAPGMTASDLYHGWFYRNGALKLASSLGWGIQMLREDARRHGLREASDALEQAWTRIQEQSLYAPYGEHPTLRAEALPSYVKDWFAHAEPDNYWQSLDISAAIGRILVPALHISGWFDTYLNGSVDGFLALRRGAATEFARNHQYLLAGPWIHIPWGDTIGEENFGPEARIDTDQILLRWFNHWLKDTGEFEHEPRIRHFALGENYWHNADEWPTAPNHTLYMRSRGKANSRKGDGALSRALPTEDEPHDVFVYDPEVPVFAPGGKLSLSSSRNQAEMEMGNNVLVYTGEPLRERLHVFGHPSVTLYAATSATHADLTAKLVRVLPDGRAMFFSMGIARSSWLFRETKYTADTTHCWRFNLDPVSCVLAPGERLRLEIAGSAFPLFDRNPSTPLPAAQAGPWNWSRSTHQILHTPAHASALHLPVLECA